MTIYNLIKIHYQNVFLKKINKYMNEVLPRAESTDGADTDGVLGPRPAQLVVYERERSLLVLHNTLY